MLISMLQDICGCDLFSSIINALQTDLFSSSGVFSAVSDMVRSLNLTIITPVALMLMLIWFLVNIEEKASIESLTPDIFLRAVISLFVCKFLIDYGYDLLTHMFTFGLALTNKILASSAVSTSVSTGDNTAMLQKMLDQFKEERCDGNGILFALWDFVMIVLLVIPWLIAFIMKIVIKVIVYTRVMEVYLRASFAPIAFSDMFKSGTNGSGWRFLKTFLATCLQGAMILVIAAIYSALMQGILESSLSGSAGLLDTVGLYICFMGAAVMLTIKSIGIAKELVGV